MVDIKVVSQRSKKEIGSFATSSSTTVGELKKQISSKTKLGTERIRLAVPSKTSKLPNAFEALGKDSDLVSKHVGSDSTLYFKDLGPQISWSLVFICEYAGPLFVYPIFYFLSNLIYGTDSPKSFAQKVALVCYSLHYIKRIYETIFVHRFSHGTMPIFNLFKNCSYYWGCTAMVSYFVNHPLYTEAPIERVYLGLALWIVGEVFNYICHIQLRNLRPAGSTERKIPRGLLFELVSCPNYTVEILSWIGFSILTQTLTSWVFTLMGAAQMWIWAVGKHRRYRKEFGDKYPKSRKILIPFLL
ncbi:hypothetical protein ACTFIV_000127 [Dictyostelium citrinum]